MSPLVISRQQRCDSLPCAGSLQAPVLVSVVALGPAWLRAIPNIACLKRDALSENSARGTNCRDLPGSSSRLVQLWRLAHSSIRSIAAAVNAALPLAPLLSTFGGRAMRAPRQGRRGRARNEKLAGAPTRGTQGSGTLGSAGGRLSCLPSGVTAGCI